MATTEWCHWDTGTCLSTAPGPQGGIICASLLWLQPLSFKIAARTTAPLSSFILSPWTSRKVTVKALPFVGRPTAEFALLRDPHYFSRVIIVWPIHLTETIGKFQEQTFFCSMWSERFESCNNMRKEMVFSCFLGLNCITPKKKSFLIFLFCKPIAEVF